MLYTNICGVFCAKTSHTHSGDIRDLFYMYFTTHLKHVPSSLKICALYSHWFHMSNTRTPEPIRDQVS